MSPSSFGSKPKYTIGTLARDFQPAGKKKKWRPKAPPEVHWSRCFRLFCLLEELQNSLLRLVGLRQGCHAGLLQHVVLRHLRDRRADVSVLDVVLRAGQVRDFGVFHVDDPRSAG